MENYNIFGVVTGTASVTSFPSGTAVRIRLKADPANIGTFFIGSLPVGTTYYPIDAGQEVDWFVAPVGDGNLAGLHNFQYSNPSGTSDYLYYWLQR